MTDAIKNTPERPRMTGLRGNELARGADWAVAIAAGILLLLSVGGYLYHRDQLASITVERLRLHVCAPPWLAAGQPAEIYVLVTNMAERPVAAQVEVALLRPDDKPILHRTVQTSEDGLLTVAVPGQQELPQRGLQLEVTASRNGSRETFTTSLPVHPIPDWTCLATLRPSYQPGHTMLYRSITFSQVELTPAPKQRVEFQFQNVDGDVVPGSFHEETTTEGVSCGAFAIPADLPAGEYALVARSAEERFSDVRLPVIVGNGQAMDDSVDLASTGTRVRFRPESGYLVPDLENRVYFSARNPRGEPIDLKGMVVDADDNPVAVVETFRPGLGTFSFQPQLGGRYRLKIVEPPGVENEPQLSEVEMQHRMVLSAGVGVFGPGQPLGLNLRAAREGLPAVVTAWCRGRLVGYKPVVTRVLGGREPHDNAQAGGAFNQVTVNIADTVSGPIQLIVYDYSASPPTPVAGRWVYRHSARRLNVDLTPKTRHSASGRQMTIALTVTDETGTPAPAVLAVSALDRTTIASTEGNDLPRLACFMNAAIDWGVLPPDANPDMPDAETDIVLDLLLGMRSSSLGNFAEKAGEAVRESEGSVAGPPPIVYDNLQPLRKEYEKMLDQYRHERTRILTLLTTLSFLGGFGLVLAVAMLGLLGVVSGLRLWIPASGTMVCCLLIGAMLLAPLRRGEPMTGGGAFLSYTAPEHDHVGSPGEEQPPESTATPRASTGLPADGRDAGQSADSREHGDALFWKCLLTVGPNGRAEIHFDLPDATEEVCIEVAAHGAGRVGAVRTCLEATDPVY